jgi:hypothetical protein
MPGPFRALVFRRLVVFGRRKVLKNENRLAEVVALSPRVCVYGIEFVGRVITIVDELP